MTTTGDLAVWFRGVLDADEQVARAAIGHRWVGYPRRQSVEVAEGDQVGVKVVAAPTNFEHWEHRPDYAAGPQTFQHIARFDPAFVLADIAAKRTILDLHTNRGGWGHECVTIRRDAFGRVRLNEEYYEADSPCQTLRLLARPYRGREGWCDEWEMP